METVQEPRAGQDHVAIGPMVVVRCHGGAPLCDAQVLTAAGEVAELRTRVALEIGEQLSFRVGPTLPPVVAEVTGQVHDAERAGFRRIFCRCVINDFPRPGHLAAAG